MAFLENVVVKFEAISAGLGKSSKKLSENLDSVANRQRLLNNTIKPLSRNFQAQKAFIQAQTQALVNQTGVLGLSQDQFNAFNRVGGVFNTRLQKMTAKIRMATAGMKGFKMAALGVLFFGLLIKGFFSGLLKPAGNLVGIFDLLTLTLELLFLPVMIKLLPLFTFLLDLVSSIPDSVKLAIGVFVILGAIFGTLLFLVSAFTLGVGALASMEISLGAIFATTTAIFVGFAAVILLLIGSYMILTSLFGDENNINKLVVGIGILTTGFILLTAATKGWGVAFALVTSPIFAVFAAIIAGIFLITKLTTFGLAQQGLEYKNTFAAILGGAIDFGAGLINIFVFAFGFIGSLLVGIKTAFTETFKNIGSIIKKILTGDFSGALDEFKKGFSTAAEDFIAGIDITKQAGFSVNDTALQLKQSLGLVKNLPQIGETSFTPNNNSIPVVNFNPTTTIQGLDTTSIIAEIKIQQEKDLEQLTIKLNEQINASTSINQ